MHSDLNPTKTYPAVGQCIYCGASEYAPGRTRALGAEHIIPESLGGKLVLPLASCGRCEGVTSSFEQFMAKKTFGALRYHLDLPSKRPKDRPTTLPVRYLTTQGWKRIQTPVQIAPFVVCTFYFDPPKLVDPSDHGPTYVACALSLNDEHAQECMRRFSATQMDNYSGQFKGPPLTLLLAKIAHSYATAEIGLGNFTPLLPEIIGAKDSLAAMQFVGGTRDEMPKSDALHEISLRKLAVRGTDYWVVDIRLFSSLGLPAYYVIAGKV